MGQAAKAIGNTELEEKFAKSLEMLERPNTVVFNPSYVRLLSWPFLTMHLTRPLKQALPLDYVTLQATVTLLLRSMHAVSPARC
jgi:hypothetical protein